MAKSDIEFTAITSYEIALNELEHLREKGDAKSYNAASKIVDKQRKWIVSSLGIKDIEKIPPFEDK